MINITIKVHENLINMIDELVERGYFMSRSEAIRFGMLLLLKRFEKIFRIGDIKQRVDDELKDEVEKL